VRFLIDAQLPPALARHLVVAGHEAIHVADVGLQRADDRIVWKCAVDLGAALVSGTKTSLPCERLRGRMDRRDLGPHRQRKPADLDRAVPSPSFRRFLQPSTEARRSFKLGNHNKNRTGRRGVPLKEPDVPVDRLFSFLEPRKIRE